ncbi:hypothetical protein [Sphingomonas sp.]|nr:hypothetical protein [Sphingomonas sp.]MBA4763306.1 hypothetical protein [Sphingomonas sp.]
MSDPINLTVESPTTDAPRAWSDPVCTEYAVDELTQANAPAVVDLGLFS